MGSKVAGGLFAIVASVASFSSRAFVTTSTVCNNCDEIELELRARALGNGDHYLSDLVKRKLTHLRVTGVTVPSSRGDSSTASISSGEGNVTNIPVTSSEQSLFNAVQEIYDTNGSLDVSLTMGVSVPLSQVPSSSRLMAAGSGRVSLTTSSGDITAFDVVANVRARETVGGEIGGDDWISRFYYGVRVASYDVINLVKKMVPFFPDVSMRDKVSFHDGSYAIYGFDYATQSYHYVLDSARDGAGNLIPSSKMAAAGAPGAPYKKYTYPSTSVGLLAGKSQIDNLNRLGIPVGLPSGVPMNHGFVITCVGEGGQTSCMINVSDRPQ